MTPLLGLALCLLLGGGVTLWVGETAKPLLAVAACLGPGLLIVAGRFAWAGHSRCAVVLSCVGIALAGAAQARIGDLRAWSPPNVDLGLLEVQTSTDGTVRIEGVLRHDAAPTLTGASLDIRIDRIDLAGEWLETDLGARLSVGGAMVAAARPDWTRGRRVRVAVAALRRPLPYRNFGVGDAERELARRHLRLLGTVKSAALVEWRRGPWWEEAAAAIRAHVRESVRRRVSPQVAAVTIAILIGDRTGLSPDEERRLQRAGTYHVIAISGGNVAVWLGALAWVPRWRRAGVRAGTSLIAAGLLAFAWTVDGGASVARASLVAALWLLARWWDLRTSALQAMAGAVAILVIADPLALHDPGFLLSFGATLALLVMGRLREAARSDTHAVAVPTNRPFRRRLDAAARAVALVVLATLAVELVLVPIGARWFSMVTAVGLIANLAALPAMAAVQVAGMVLVGADTLGLDGVARVSGRLAAYGVSVLIGSGALSDRLPWLVRAVPPPSLGFVAGYYACLSVALTLLWPGSRDGRVRRVVGSVAAVGALAVLAVIASGRVGAAPIAPWRWAGIARLVQTATWPRDQWLVVTVLDVGQGDATVVQFPNGRTWLVDAGGAQPGSAFDVGARVTAPALWALGIAQLDRLVVTHADADHAGGVPAVIERFAPRELVVGVRVPDDPRDAALVASGVAGGADIREVRRGERFASGSIHVHVLHPPAPDWARIRVRNDDSVALWIRHGDVGLLLPGDAGLDVEPAWAEQVAAAPLTVIRAGHHGSRSATGHRLIDHFRPALIVTSSGRGNRFGHPHREVLDTASRVGARVMRTDLHGAVQLATNGHVLVVRSADGSTAVFTPEGGVSATEGEAGRRRAGD